MQWIATQDEESPTKALIERDQGVVYPPAAGSPGLLFAGIAIIQDEYGQDIARFAGGMQRRIVAKAQIAAKPVYDGSDGISSC